MNIAIVDDTKADRLLLEETLMQYDSINALGFCIDRFTCGEALLQVYQPFHYTVIFLDIYMDGMSGIETAKKIREADEDTAIVFLTTSDAHRPDAFAVFAAAYLSKPLEEAEVFRVLDHILRIRNGKDRCFRFSYDRQNYSLPFSDIVSIETDGNYLVITDRDAQAYRTRMTFSAAATRVDSRFLVLMKGIMVNMDFVRQIEGSACTMKNGTVFPLRVRSGKEIRQTWLNYRFAAIREATEMSGVKTSC